MKKCVCVFKDVNGDKQYQTFYGEECDVLAANYFSAHPGLELISCETVE